MESVDFLYIIKINECPLIKQSYSMVFDFCLRNKIEIIGALVEKYENGEVSNIQKKR